MSYQKSGSSPKNALSKLNAQPSPASTNRPSASEYGSLLASTATTTSSSNGSLIQMPSNGNNPNLTGFINDEEVIESIHATRRSRSAMMKGGLAILVGAIVLVAIVGAIVVQDESSPTATTNHRHNNLATNSVHEQHGLISRAARTFSDKHPVHDLKIPLLERPAFSLPNPALFGNNHNQATTTAALPTNAWYQNLLLPMGSSGGDSSSGGDGSANVNNNNNNNNNPTEEQRVYPVPYLVDVVGPIPGLRLHHPSVIASDHVVQVVQVLSHGLTVGASTRAHFLDNEPVLSNRYGISKMTPLGITLEWVCLLVDDVGDDDVVIVF